MQNRPDLPVSGPVSAAAAAQQHEGGQKGGKNERKHSEKAEPLRKRPKTEALQWQPDADVDVEDLLQAARAQ